MFTSKITYIAARTEWKNNYFELSAKIRETREAYHNDQKTFAKSMSNEYHKKVRGALREYEKLKSKATEALSILEGMKIEANDQWIKSRVRDV